MANLGKAPPNNQPVPKEVQGEVTTYEDEINLIDYFRVVWKHKYLILLGSVLPTVLVGLILFFWPRKFKVTYVYDVRDPDIYDVRDRDTYSLGNWNLDKKNYSVLLDRFYSVENVNKIADKFRESGLDGYAELINSASGREDLKELVDFGVLPPYMDLSELKVTDPGKLEQIRQLKAQLLNMTVICGSKNDVPKITSVVRDNFENVVPVYSMAQTIINITRGHKAEMAGIEENRFTLELTLKTNKSILAKLKNIKTGTSSKGEGDIILQFDVGGRSEYLPLGYQIQATESKVVEIEENIRVNEEKYNYYKDLLALNEKLLAELKNHTSSYYTIRQFRSSLADLADGCKKQELKDYLGSSIKKVENRISVSTPVTEKPIISLVPMGTAKKSAIVLVVCLMISIFAAFLLEGLKKSQT